MSISHHFILFLILLVTASVHGAIRFGERWATFVTEPQNWYSAFEVCQSYGMQLLTLKTENENDILREYLKDYKTKSVWVAATDIGQEGSWVWATTGLQVTSSRWRSPPDNYMGMENCAQVTMSGWNDCYCSNELPFFCEFEEPNNDTLKGTCVQNTSTKKINCQFVQKTNHVKAISLEAKQIKEI